MSPASHGECIPIHDGTRLAPPDADTDAACSALTQATFLPDVERLLVETDAGPTYVLTPHGAVVLSQTCDLTQLNRHTVQVSPLAILTGLEAADAARENRPRYAPVYAQGAAEGDQPVAFADLDVVATWTKGRLAQERQDPAAWHTTEHARRFGRAVGRRFSRFAWPDNLQAWLSPLEKVLRARYEEATQPAGRLVADLQQVRVGADRWEEPGVELTLHFIFESGVLPGDMEESPSGGTLQFLGGQPTWKQIAARLEAATKPGDRTALYQAAADAWAALCGSPAGAGPEVQEAVGLISAEITSADEFSLQMARSCPNLDIDYVSEPTVGD